MSESIRLAGLPVRCVARIRPDHAGAVKMGGSSPGAAGELLVHGKKVKLRLSGSPELTHEFSHIYGSNATQQSIFERDVQRMVRAASDGYSIAVLGLGATDSGKSFTLFGGNDTQNQPGLISLSIVHLFSLLKAKVRGGQGGFSLEMQFMQIVEDSVVDLLDPQKGDLPVEDTADGSRVTRARSQPLADEQELAEWLGVGARNRIQGVSEFGPLAPRSTQMVIFTLQQKIPSSSGTGASGGSATGNTTEILSKLVFAELPGLELLAEASSATILAQQGPQLNRELLGLVDVIECAASPQHADFVDYSQSKSTRLLEDALGGNAICLCVATLVEAQPLQSAVTVKYCKLLDQIQTFPVLNDSRTTGLLRSYRVRITSAQEQIRALEAQLDGKSGRSSGSGGEDQSAVVANLRGRLVQAEQSRAAMLQEKQRVQSALAEFRTQYRELLESKTNLQSELIASEEQRLAATRMLVDMQMETNQIRESLTKEKYEIETKLLTAEGEIVELQAKDRSAESEHRDLKTEVETLKSENSNLKLEYIALRQNYVQLDSDLNELKDKNETLGVELLNLVNAKSELENKRNELRDTNEILEKVNSELSEEKNKSSESLVHLSAEAERLRHSNELMSVQIVKKDVEIQQLITDFESKKSHLDRSFVEFSKEKEAQVTAIKHRSEKERRNLMSQKAELEKQNERLVADLKISQRRLVSLEANLVALSEENGTITAQLNDLRSKLQNETEDHRNKVLNYVREITNTKSESFGAPASETSGDLAGSALVSNDGEEERRVHQAQQRRQSDLVQKITTELVNEHNEIEKQLQQQLSGAHRRNLDMTRKMRRLLEHYRVLSNFVEDMVPQGAPGFEERPLLTEEQLSSLGQQVSESDLQLQADLREARDRVVTLQQDVEHQKEMLLRQAEIARSNIEQLRTKYEGIRSKLSETSLELMTLRETHSHCQEAASNGSAQAMESLRMVQDSIKQQLEEFRANAANMSVNDELEKNYRKLETKIELIERENASLRKEYTSILGECEALKKKGQGSGDPEVEKQLKEQIAILQAAVKAYEDNEGTKFEEGISGEKERAQLMMRAARAEAELASFQSMYKNEVKRLKAKIKKLQAK